MASIKDVANQAGVSTATVSRALSLPDKVSEKTRQRVLRAVEKTGYRMNAAARQFRRQRTDTILIVVPDIGNPFFSNIIQGIEAEAQQHGYRVVLGESGASQKDSTSYAAYMQQRHADGAILLSVDGAEEFAADSQDMPVVMACEYLPNSPFPTVRIDNSKAARDAVSYLAGLGHRRIAYINGPPVSPLCKDRLRGYKQAMKAAGLAIEAGWIAAGDYSPESGYQAARELLQLKNPPTAIFTASDPMAIGAMRAATELGKNIPRDLSLIGFDDIRFAEYMSPSLTTVHQPRELIGKTAMLKLVKLLAGETVADKAILEHELIIRESTGKPGSKARGNS
jgi:LacI family repressor for deo operon, udp, cdd, tsx, nupC, and nupG